MKDMQPKEEKEIIGRKFAQSKLQCPNNSMIDIKYVPLDYKAKRERGKQHKENLFIGCKEGK